MWIDTIKDWSAPKGEGSRRTCGSARVSASTIAVVCELKLLLIDCGFRKVPIGPSSTFAALSVTCVAMKLSNPGTVPVYTIAGASTARPLPEWLARKRRRSLKKDPEYANRVELLQDFEFEEASSCVRVSEDGEWVMSTG